MGFGGNAAVLASGPSPKHDAYGITLLVVAVLNQGPYTWTPATSCKAYYIYDWAFCNSQTEAEIQAGNVNPGWLLRRPRGPVLPEGMADATTKASSVPASAPASVSQSSPRQRETTTFKQMRTLTRRLRPEYSPHPRKPKP